MTPFSSPRVLRPSGEHSPVGGRLLTPVTAVLGLLGLVSLFILAVRLVYGLGAVTNINDGYTWGTWIVLDVMVGTAFACGGYAMTVLVYINNNWEYHPLVRPALLTSVFGYTLGGVAIFVDVGRYWNGWAVFHPAYAQPNSVMWEVALCITLYVGVMWLEFTPAILEKAGKIIWLRRTRKIMFILLAFAVLLPSMHQSGLGMVLVAFGDHIHPLWQTNYLPLLFLLTAIAMGFAVVVFESYLTSHGFRRPMETPLLANMSQVMVTLLVIFLCVRLGDVAARHQFHRALELNLQAFCFWCEVILFLAPLLMLMKPANRNRPRLLFYAALCLLQGGALYRLDAYLIGYEQVPGWHYFPSVPEILATLGLVSLEVLGFIVLSKVLPVLPAPHGVAHVNGR
ncbi:MAG: Ni/Fe-hydrogenase cytochrome b subunit [Magnetococcales bacterium]|nr:Ni/Fe-hydrogenase cytochrome b subunit [Magnetococcales bacterium]